MNYIVKFLFSCYPDGYLTRYITVIELPLAIALKIRKFLDHIEPKDLDLSSIEMEIYRNPSMIKYIKEFFQLEDNPRFTTSHIDIMKLINAEMIFMQYKRILMSLKRKNESDPKNIKYLDRQDDLNYLTVILRDAKQEHEEENQDDENNYNEMGRLEIYDRIDDLIVKMIFEELQKKLLKLTHFDTNLNNLILEYLKYI